MWDHSRFLPLRYKVEFPLFLGGSLGFGPFCITGQWIPFPTALAREGARPSARSSTFGGFAGQAFCWVPVRPTGHQNRGFAFGFPLNRTNKFFCKSKLILCGPCQEFGFRSSEPCGFCASWPHEDAGLHKGISQVAKNVIHLVRNTKAVTMSRAEPDSGTSQRRTNLQQDNCSSVLAMPLAVFFLSRRDR